MTKYFKWDVQYRHLDDGGLLEANGIAPGAQFTGSFQYDDAATNTNAFDVFFDKWDLSGFSSTLPGSGSVGEIIAADHGATDSWRLRTQIALPGLDAGQAAIFEMTIGGDFGYNQGSAIDVGVGGGRPVQAPPSTDVFGADATIDIDYTNANGALIRGFAGGEFMIGDTSFATIEEPEDPAPVPLPAGLPLLLAGLGAFGVLRRRR